MLNSKTDFDDDSQPEMSPYRRYFISETMKDIFKIPAADLGFQPQKDQRKCSQAIASATNGRK